MAPDVGPPAPPLLEVANLTKRFPLARSAAKNGAGERGRWLTAVDDVSLSLHPGEILGLLGPNGAGKTTTIQMLLGLITPTAGRIRMFGMDLADHREEILGQVNFSSAYVALPYNLTVWENLLVFAHLYGVANARERIRELLKTLDLAEVANTRTGLLSSGQATRVNLCKALINRPRLLLLDEPTASLDPDAADRIRSTLQGISSEISMLYTSHNMAEVEQMCHRVIFLNKGRIIAEGSPAEIARRYERADLEQVFLRIAREGQGEGSGMKVEG